MSEAWWKIVRYESSQVVLGGGTTALGVMLMTVHLIVPLLLVIANGLRAMPESFECNVAPVRTSVSYEELIDVINVSVVSGKGTVAPGSLVSLVE